MKKLFLIKKLFIIGVFVLSPEIYSFLLLTREEHVPFTDITQARNHLKDLTQEIKQNEQALGLTKGDQDQEIIQQRIDLLRVEYDLTKKDIDRIKHAKIIAKPTKTVEEEINHLENLLERP